MLGNPSSGFIARKSTNLSQESTPTITTYNLNDTPMVHKLISRGNLTVVIPANYHHSAVHLQAQTTMQQISIQDADIINTDTPAVTSYPRTDNSPALIIWQLPGSDDKIPKAVGISVSGRRTEPPSTTHSLSPVLLTLTLPPPAPPPPSYHTCFYVPPLPTME
jgi:hypothetical protein